MWDHGTGQPRTTRGTSSPAALSGKPSGGTFSSGTYQGSYIPSTSTFGSFTERGSTVYKILTPAALTFARTHFGCFTLNGVELEDEGGSGTAGSHWQQRIYQNEIMTGVSRNNDVVYSNLTLSYLYDTGWYVPNYGAAGQLLWGKGKGCNFALNKCLTAGTTPTTAFSEFCTSSTTGGCTFDHTAIGMCNVGSYTSALPSYFQYWTSSTTTGGTGLTMDACPYIAAYSNLWCTDAADQPINNYRGESYVTQVYPNSPASRCFDSTLFSRSYTVSTTATNAGCYAFYCNTTAYVLYVKISAAKGFTAASAWYACTDGGTITPSSEFGFSS